ncbi:MAG: L,D-transpeptidase family protein [Chitinophagales bacterium]|nr:L,D-transpeptidase family protein [Chitinophagales bacterium]MDW8419336.1 L,D-transpeptidase family protein [Chitinophagales bacterium]
MQRTHTRVNNAYKHVESHLMARCAALNVSENFDHIFLRAFKKEAELEIWIKNVQGEFVLFNTYKIYAQSGTLGPKRQQGDAQVPEGFYYIREFNPYSRYHLSLGINYPNESDMLLSSAPHKGGSIYIHGGSVSAGCLAMSDKYIEEIYVCAVKARNAGQEKIPVHIFPFRMTTQNMMAFLSHPQLKIHSRFWYNLQQGYLYFEEKKRVPVVQVNNDGYYTFSDSETSGLSATK